MSISDGMYDEENVLPFPYDEYGGRRISIVDLNLVSGSSDYFRNSVGGFFFNEIDDYGQVTVPPTFQNMNSAPNRNPLIYSIVSYAGSSINDAIFNYETGIGIAETDSSDINGYLAHKQETILPFTKFVCHVEADSTEELLLSPSTGNKFWQCCFTGDKFENSTVERLYSNSVFDQHYTSINIPYEAIQKNTFSDGASIRSISEISYDYNQYDRKYQNSLENYNSEKQIPNWYITNLIANSDYNNNPSFADKKILDYYKNGTKAELQFTAAEATNPQTDSINQLNKLIENTQASDSMLQSEINRRQTNLIFNSDNATSFLKHNSAPLINSNLLPFYNKINFTVERTGKYGKEISKNKYSTTFLRTIKEVFLNQTNELLPTEQLQFMINERFLSASIDTKYDVGKSTSQTVEFRGVDFTELLLYSHNKIKDDQGDFTVIGQTNVESKAASDTVGVYRAFNTRNTLRTINDTISNFVNDSNAFYMSDINSLLNLQNKTVDGGVGPFNQPQQKPNEAVAYRVEKIAGAVSGDSNTQGTIQNFWIFNSEDLEEFNLIDSQVKYNTDYTYKIYAYYLIEGVKYKFSNLQLTRVVGTVREQSGYSGDTDIPSGAGSDSISPLDNPVTAYCVEYYDPVTGDLVVDLLEGEVGDVGVGTITSFAVEDTIRIRRSSASDEIIPPYFANFIVTTQPSLKLVEVPIHTKQITITDHVPNNVNVDPSYSLDNSNTLIFNLNYQIFTPELYPKITTAAEETFKAKYLNSNDLTNVMKLRKNTVSPARFIDIYRIDKKPKSYLDFESGYLKTIDNKIADKDFAYKSSIFYDKVKSNKQYYYLFRTRNELNISGQNSQIIKAELVNDGGYKYALFDVMNDRDMIVENYKNISEPFKRLIEVIPNAKHLVFNDDGVDYSQSAASQYENLKVGDAEELIWNNTFKLRLTSKKTGKKIDLNITYNDPNVKLDE